LVRAAADARQAALDATLSVIQKHSMVPAMKVAAQYGKQSLFRTVRPQPAHHRTQSRRPTPDIRPALGQTQMIQELDQPAST
jgi:hypothetical protein